MRDLPQIAELLERQGVELDELELARLVRVDPRIRLAICATALVDARESVVGVGAIDLRSDPNSGPSLVVVDKALTEGLDQLLSDALIGRAQALATTHAA